MSNLLQYHYNGKKQKKPPRVAYVPKHNIQITGPPRSNDKSFMATTNKPMTPIAYKSSVSLPGFQLPTNPIVDDDDNGKPPLLFQHKTINTNPFSELLQEKTNVLQMMKETRIVEKQATGTHDTPLLKEMVTKLMSEFREKGVKKIVNVYQEEYKDGKKASGFGDFIRGSYYLMQFCRANQIQFDLNMMNHPLSIYFKNKKPCREEHIQIFKEIEPLSGNNFVAIFEPDKVIRNTTDVYFSLSFVQQLLETRVYKDTMYIYAIPYPYSESISELDKIYMRYKLEPTREIDMYVQYIMKVLKLKDKDYITIHIRSGDRYLIKGAIGMTDKYLFQIREYLDTLLASYPDTQQYLLLSDNITLKKLLVKEYGERIHAMFLPITHSGEGVVFTETSIKNTLVDFYLLSKSREIYSYSTYHHGTGFSKWTAETYNIPYICKFVEVL